MPLEKCLRSPASVDHRQLLYELKKTADLWFLSCRGNPNSSANDGESFFQVLQSLKNILTDGLHKACSEEGEQAKVNLIRQLNWLSPTVSNDDVKICSFPLLQLRDPFLQWIYSSFQNATLCGRLQLLVADLELLTTYYNCQAFLYNDRYATALFICLSAIELNQSSLISQIDSSLYAARNLVTPKHKRSSSHPNFSISPRKSSLTSLARTDSVGSYAGASPVTKAPEVLYRLREWKSLPNFQPPVKHMRVRSKTFSQPSWCPDYDTTVDSTCSSPTALDHTLPSSSNSHSFSPYSDMPSTSQGLKVDQLVPINLVKCDDIKIYFDQGHNHDRKVTPDECPELIEYDSPPKTLGSINFLSCISANFFSITDASAKDATASASSSFSNSNDFMSVFLPQEGKKLKRYRNSLFEDHDENPENVLKRRLPANGQSLTAFLHGVNFTRNNTDLERENAHFSMSEAMICVIEKMKCSKAQRKRQQIMPGTTDTMSKCEKVAETKVANSIRCGGSWNKSQSSVGLSTSPFSEIDDSEDDFNFPAEGSIDDHCDDLMKELIHTNQNDNDHTAYAEWGGDNTLEALSAEGVALSLISKFSDYQLPQATDLTWLVSRKDAPQDLLPIPDCPSADAEENYAPPVLRGTRDWAPPRPQIIFTNHPYPNRKQLLQQQNYRCTGCGMRVSRAYMNRFRYCTYLGKFHCTGCHRNQMSIIPAKVLEKWDFTYNPVSVFAYRLLEQIWTYPLFHVPDLNASLYTKFKVLSLSRLKRVQLKYIQDFIITCRFATEEKKLFDNIAPYITSEPDKWSMFDFVAVRDGTFPKTVSNLISKSEEHVFNCELCTARGFICERCPKKQVIFPWQNKVYRCDYCGTCLHQKCRESLPDCVKCHRLRTRKERIS